MSEKSNNLSRPFARKHKAAAKKMATGYKILLENADGEWYGTTLELPGVNADGKTPAECVKNTTAAIEAMIAYYLEASRPVPLPSSTGKRTEQVNVRLTVEEKARLEAAATSQGFKGVSDFARIRLLDAVGK